MKPGYGLFDFRRQEQTSSFALTLYLKLWVSLVIWVSVSGAGPGRFSAVKARLNKS